MIRDSDVYNNNCNSMALRAMPKDDLSSSKATESETTQPLILGLALLAVPHSER